VGPVPDLILLRESGSTWNRTQISASISRNSDYQTAEAVLARYRRSKRYVTEVTTFLIIIIIIKIIFKDQTSLVCSGPVLTVEAS
jgi:hypothetical protein